MERHYLDMMLHGHVNKKSWEDVWTGEQVRARKSREREAATDAMMEGAEGVEGVPNGDAGEGTDPEPKYHTGWESDSSVGSAWETDEEVGEVDWDRVKEWANYEPDEGSEALSRSGGVTGAGARGEVPA